MIKKIKDFFGKPFNISDYYSEPFVKYICKEGPDLVFDYGPPDLVFDYGPWTQKVQIAKEEWAPGLWAGCEGMKFKVKSIDMENRIVELEYIGNEE